LERLPVIDMAPLFDAQAPHGGVAAAIATACEAHGFFYLVGHGITPQTLQNLEAASRAFFVLPEEAKLEVAMAQGGAAWRGFFPVGGELTSGRPDLKEGLYFGQELGAEHPRVRDHWPLHGANLWPTEPVDLRPAVEAYMAQATRAAQTLMRGVSLGLGLSEDYFSAHYTADPTVLFRIFHYPAQAPGGPQWDQAWGVGEHTDYGLLTLLAQDAHGGLQVKTPAGWIEAPPIEGALVCNIGDMLDRLTGGRYRSTPHRVRNLSGRDRLSFPLFFDPDFAAQIVPLPGERGGDSERWDGQDLQALTGTYGDYLMSKVAKVFPDLGEKVL
jgi:isopenicillin N synthase-like dioxygenase